MFPDDSINEHVLNADLELYAHTLILICLKNNIKNKYVRIEPLQLESNQQGGISTTDIFSLTSYESDLFLREDLLESKPSNGSYFWSIDALFSIYDWLLFSVDNNNSTCVLNEEAMEQLIHFLELYSTSISDVCHNLDDEIEAFRYLGSFSLLLLHVQKFQSYYEIESTLG